MDKTFSHLCSECGSVFRTRSGLRKHFNTKHKETTKYKCETCHKSFAEKHQLRAHNIQHGGIGVKCNICLKEFTTKSSLKRHMDGAHGNAKFTCSTCQRVFKDNDVLKEHVSAIHMQQYRYVCDVGYCGARFRWRTSLARHNKSKHTEMTLLFSP